jgi:hypothetical protein
MAVGSIRMRAKVAFTTNDGEKVRAGQAFSCTPAFAAAYRYQGKADFIDAATHRREQRAEQQGEQVPVGGDAPADAPSGRGRGSYRRRDLRAEDSEKS